MPRLPFILTVAVLSAFGLIASDVYLPAMPHMSADFGIADWQTPQTVSIHLLALGVSALFGTGYGVLGGSVLTLGLMALGSCLWERRRQAIEPARPARYR